MVRAWDFYPGRTDLNPTIGGKFSQLCFILLLRLSCRKMGACPRLNFISPKWFRVIINDVFLGMGWGGGRDGEAGAGMLRPITPTIDNLPHQISHNLLVYIFSL